MLEEQGTTPQSIDPIVEELDRLRAEQLESYHFDFEAFDQDLKDQEKLSPQPVQAPQESPVGGRVSTSGRYTTRRRWRGGWDSNPRSRAWRLASG